MRVDALHPYLRKSCLKNVVCRYGSAYHIRCEECSDDRYRYHDRVEEIAYDTEGKSEGGDDECKLTYLCHGESAAQRLFQRLSGEQISEESRVLWPMRMASVMTMIGRA